MSTLPSNIRVFVKWMEPTVFAGEDVECTITFRNMATGPKSTQTPALRPSDANGHVENQRKTSASVVHAKSSPIQNQRSFATNRGHRTTLSLTVPVTSGIQQSQGRALSHGAIAHGAREGKAHKRSVSIVSISTPTTEKAAGESGNYVHMLERPRRVSKGHGRSASLHTLQAPVNQRLPMPTSPLAPCTHQMANLSLMKRRKDNLTPVQYTTGQCTNTPVQGKGSDRLPSPPQFKFPVFPAENIQSSPTGGENEEGLFLSPPLKDLVHPTSEPALPAARVLSPASATGTPRSSGEFYTISNNSTETLASEYQNHHPAGLASHAGHLRRSSNLSHGNQTPKQPETLMMGYAQVQGYFTLDPSLINQAPFEEVKRKGAIGGQGGGVIGIEKRDTGPLRGLGWGNIGESLGALLGGGELSSIKEMKGIVSSRSIPLLSIPQSILFVDLRLGPGESRTYKYSYQLPRGLPPTHRGKAMKISYKLVIGTQRSGGAREQQVRSVEVPFRVLGSVNEQGELLGHDLMSPYIILRDQARVKAIAGTNIEPATDVVLETKSKSSESTLDNFLWYVDELLSKPQQQDSSPGLLSPSEIPRFRRQLPVEDAPKVKDAIDMAILRSNVATEAQQCANKFEIARSGRRVAIVMLARPSYRLGETINTVIDFTDAGIPCYAIHAALETSEKLDSAISLRSEASILRITRKTYVSHSESTLFSRRAVFTPTIPTSATPEFVTSGVSLDWRIRVEFVTPRLGLGSDSDQRYTELLEEVSRDERGLILAAAETLDCEIFEIAVPIRVYGAITKLDGGDEITDGLSV